MTQLETEEFPFILPKGYIDNEGNRYRDGTMRLAREFDEIAAGKDRRVYGNPAYKEIVLLSRVITRLGPLTQLDGGEIEKFFTSDVEYLIDFCNKVNGKETKVTCPHCQHDFNVGVGPARK